MAELAVFAPKSFENLRSVFGISEGSYRQSIFSSGPFVSFQSNSKGAARVGGVFFFTRDGAYMIKTIKVRFGGSFFKIIATLPTTCSLTISFVLHRPNFRRKKKPKRF